jgi:dolichyl-phosphate beta-glucosyltransferase
MESDTGVHPVATLSPTADAVEPEALVAPPIWEPADLFGNPIPELTIVIPMHREATRIEATVAALAGSPLHRPGVAFVFVDDGSDDATATVAFRAMERHRLGFGRVLVLPRNVGKGAAIAAGMADARGEYLAFLDADLSLDPADVSRAFARLQVTDADAIVGVRIVDERHQPRLRRIASLVFRTMASSIVATGVTDPQCAMKIFRGDVAKDLFGSLATAGYAFDVELLARARRDGVRVLELPIAWEHQEGSKVRPVADGLAMLRELLSIRGHVRRHGRRGQSAARSTTTATASR